MAVFPEYSLLRPGRSKGTQEARDSAWAGAPGQPKRIQMDEGGEWENEVRTDLCPERATRRQFRGAGAHSRILERRYGLARGNLQRLVAGDRLSGKQIVSEVRWSLNTPAS